MRDEFSLFSGVVGGKARYQSSGIYPSCPMLFVSWHAQAVFSSLRQSGRRKIAACRTAVTAMRAGIDDGGCAIR